MARYNIAIDLGDDNTSIYKLGGSVVLREPTLIAFDSNGKSKVHREIGLSAKKMVGKAWEDLDFYSPLNRGEITDEQMAEVLLSGFLNKIRPDGLIKPQYKAILTVPCGLDEDQRLEYKRLGYGCGFVEVTLVPASVCSLLGMGISHNDSQAHAVVNLGGGITDIAVISASRIISGITMELGGCDLDMDICEYVLGQHGVVITQNQAEKIKNEIAGLLKNDIRSIAVDGVDKKSSIHREIVIFSKEIKEMVENYFEKVSVGIEKVLYDCTSEVISDITKTGIYLCGGLSRIIGLDRFLSKRLKMPVFIDDEGEFSTIFGAGVLVNNPEIVNKIKL